MNSLLNASDLTRKGTQFCLAARFYSALTQLRLHLSSIARKVESGDPTAIERAPEEIRLAVTEVMGKTPTLRFGAAPPRIVDAAAIIKDVFEDYSRGVFLGYTPAELDALPSYGCQTRVESLEMVIVQVVSFVLGRKTQSGYVDIHVSFESNAEGNAGSIFFEAKVPQLTQEELDGIEGKVPVAFGLENPLSMAKFFAVDAGEGLCVVNRGSDLVVVEFQLPRRCQASA